MCNRVTWLLTLSLASLVFSTFSFALDNLSKTQLKQKGLEFDKHGLINHIRRHGESL